MSFKDSEGNIILTGKDVKPQVINNYQGEDIKLNDLYTLSKNQYKSLNNKIGQSKAMQNLGQKLSSGNAGI